MREELRKHFAFRLRELLDKNVPRKKAFLQVKVEIREIDPDLPQSRASIYSWCKKFAVSTR